MRLTIKVHVEDSNGDLHEVAETKATEYVAGLLHLCLRGRDVRQEEIQALEASIYDDEPACSLMAVETRSTKIEEP